MYATKDNNPEQYLGDTDKLSEAQEAITKYLLGGQRGD
jgi:hypothetical protein